MFCIEALFINNSTLIFAISKKIYLCLIYLLQNLLVKDIRIK